MLKAGEPDFECPMGQGLVVVWSVIGWSMQGGSVGNANLTVILWQQQTLIYLTTCVVV